MTQSELIKFFNDRPALKSSIFAVECGINPTLLWYILNNQRRLQTHQAKQIEHIAKKYGWEI
jgi:hypothetical protein